MENIEQLNWAVFHERGGPENPDAGWTTGGVEIFTARNGQLSVRIVSKEDGRAILLHSSVDPEREAKRLVENTEFPQGSVVLIEGFGLGYLVEAVLEKIPENMPVFVCEPNRDLFYTSMQSRDLRHILSDERLCLSVNNIADDVAGRFACVFNVAKHKEVVHIGLPGHQSVYKELFPEIRRSIKDVVSAKLIHWTTWIGIGQVVTHNILKNLYDYSVNPGINTLKDKFADKPAIIVAAGPSLDKNVHLLHEAKGKALIIAVGTAMKALIKHNIVPDFVVSIDPIPLSYEHLRDIETEAMFIVDLQSPPEVWKLSKGKVFSSGGHPILRWFGEDIEEKGFLPSGGSVANNAMTAAFRMGANPIILIGQDLGYPAEGRTHATGTTYEKDVCDKNSAHMLYVKGNDGGEILTDRLLNQYRNFFKSWFLGHPERKYINATEGGALIEGAEILTLKEVIQRYCTEEIKVEEVLREVRDSYQPPSLTVLAEALRKRLAEAEKYIKQTEKAVKGLRDLQNACERGLGKRINRNLSSISKIYNRCQKDQFIIPAAEYLVQEDILKVLYRTYRADLDEKDAYQEAIADYLLYYESTGQAIRKLRDLIRGTIDQFEERLGEGRNEDESS